MAKLAEEYLINSDISKFDFIRDMLALYDEHKYLTIKVSVGKQRTSLQNRSLYKYFTLLAIALNSAGYSVRRVMEMRPKLDIDWNKDLVKENLWAPIQEAIIGTESTKDADRKGYTVVYETLNRFTCDNFGIGVPWPCKDDLEATKNNAS